MTRNEQGDCLLSGDVFFPFNVNTTAINFNCGGKEDAIIPLSRDRSFHHVFNKDFVISRTCRFTFWDKQWGRKYNDITIFIEKNCLVQDIYLDFSQTPLPLSNSTFYWIILCLILALLKFLEYSIENNRISFSSQELSNFEIQYSKQELPSSCIANRKQVIVLAQGANSTPFPSNPTATMLTQQPSYEANNLIQFESCTDLATPRELTNNAATRRAKKRKDKHFETTNRYLFYPIKQGEKYKRKVFFESKLMKRRKICAIVRFTKRNKKIDIFAKSVYT